MVNTVNNNNASAYGVKSMTTTADSGNIYKANTNITNQNNERQLAARFGGSKKNFKGGLVVPPVQVNYKEVGVGNTNTSANITNSTKVQADLYAAKEFDSAVGQKAGRRKSRKKGRKLVGGWPSWGCMSGGRRCKSRRRRRSNSYRRRKSK